MLTLRLIYNNFGRSHYQHTPLLLLQNFLTRPIENVKYIEIDDSFSLGASNCHLLWKLNLWTFKVYQCVYRNYFFWNKYIPRFIYLLSNKIKFYLLTPFLQFLAFSLIVWSPISCPHGICSNSWMLFLLIEWTNMISN